MLNECPSYPHPQWRKWVFTRSPFRKQSGMKLGRSGKGLKEFGYPATMTPSLVQASLYKLVHPDCLSMDSNSRRISLYQRM